MKKYKEILVTSTSVNDLDLEEPFYENGEDEPNEIDDINMYNDTTSICIKDLIGIITDFKNRGVTRVYINVDVDHHGYEFVGVNFKEIE